MARPTGVRARLLVVVLVAVLPVVVLLVLRATGERERAAEDVREESLRVARLFADRQSEIADDLTALLRALTATAGSPGFDETCASIPDVLASQRPFDGLALLRRSDGRTCGTDLHHDTDVAPGAVRRSYLLAPTPALVVTVAGADVVAAGRARIDLGAVAELAELPEGSTFSIFDGNGRIFARYPAGARFVGSRRPDAPLVRSVTAHGEGAGTFESAGLDGVERLYGHAPIDASSPELHVAVGSPTAAAFADADADLRRAVALAAATALLAVAFTLLLAELMVTRPSNARLSRIAREREALLREVLVVHDEERRRLAEDIHDDTIQVLTAAGLRVQQLRRRAEDGPLADAAREAEVAVGRAIADLRGLMVALLPEGTTEGLAPLLRRVLDDELAPYDLAWDLDVDLPAEPSAEVASFLARNVREAVRNAAKHAGASRVEVRLAPVEDGVEAVVTDDGAGFDPAAPVAEGHVGLRTMRQRTERVGGWLEVTSAPGAGTTVRFGVPAS